MMRWWEGYNDSTSEGEMEVPPLFQDAGDDELWGKCYCFSIGV